MVDIRPSVFGGVYSIIACINNIAEMKIGFLSCFESADVPIFSQSQETCKRQSFADLCSRFTIWKVPQEAEIFHSFL